MTKLRFVQEKETDVNVRKRNLRAYMKEVRSALDNRDVKEEALQAHTLQLLEEKRKQTGGNKAFVYLSFSSEADTDRLIETLLRLGYEVYCPKTEGEEMSAVRYGEDFTLSAFGTREPVGDKLETAPDYVIVPLLAMDKAGNRLGYGKGFYDRYLRKYPQSLRIGYAFHRQIVREIPHSDEDEKLQYLVTENGIIRIGEKI